jgi:hypothetical protein
MNERHKWSITDNIIALYLCKYSTSKINYTYNEIANKLGMTTDKLKMRGANFKSLMEDGKGLPDISEQTAKVYECFNDLNANEFRELVIKLLA